MIGDRFAAYRSVIVNFYFLFLENLVNNIIRFLFVGLRNITFASYLF
jgi:hypothetical protein